MARSNADLLAIKTELTNDPLDLGLTILSTDDEANANKLNAISAATPVERNDVPASEVARALDRVEYAAAVLADRQWIDVQLGTGLIDARTGSGQRSGLLGIFGANTTTRTKLSALLTTPGSRIAQMAQLGLVESGSNLTPSEVAQSRNAT